MEHLHFRELPAGCNVVVAIMCYTGYNQEDSVLVRSHFCALSPFVDVPTTTQMNQSAIDRGLFRSVYYRSYQDREKRDSGAATGNEIDELVEQFEVPNRETCAGVKRRNYAKLDVDGLVMPATRVTGSRIDVSFFSNSGLED